MNDYVPIRCDDHDFLELACMERYDVELVLDEGALVGAAADQSVESHAEYLILRLEGGASRRVRLDRIRHMKILSRPSRFEAHTFASDPGRGRHRE